MFGEKQSKTEAPKPPDNAFARWAGALSEAAWLRWQRGAGVVLGIVATICLFWPQSDADADAFLTLPMLLALAIALVLPKVAEKQCGRSTSKGVLTMALTMAAGLAVYAVYHLVLRTV